AAGPAAAQAPEPARNQIITHGAGEVRVPPTEAVVTVGAQVQRPSAAEAAGQAARIAEQILARLQALGIRRQDIRTSGVQLMPVFSAPREGAPEVVGYRAISTFTVTLTDLRQVGPAIDESVRAGANQVMGVRFGLGDPAEARREALTMAVREARDKAETIARAAGLTIRSVVQISEEFVGVEARGLERAVPAPAPAVPTPIEPGLITVTARVTAIFSY
ncbi:MAG TPA: SIMPL domain-containing protein, partial [bacterium]|nr:SIMPL domain-containing protein [bacterium]